MSGQDAMQSMIQSDIAKGAQGAGIQLNIMNISFEGAFKDVDPRDMAGGTNADSIPDSEKTMQAIVGGQNSDSGGDYSGGGSSGGGGGGGGGSSYGDDIMGSLAAAGAVASGSATMADVTPTASFASRVESSRSSGDDFGIG